MLYTYAFFATPADECRAPLTEIEGFQQSLTLISSGDLTAAVEPLDSLAPLQSSDEILLRSALRHDQVICQLFHYTPVLPLRFGTCFRSLDKLQDYLLHHQKHYQDLLEHLDNRAEYLLKAFVSTSAVASDSPPPLSGADYLRSRKHHYLQQQETQRQLQEETQTLDLLWPVEWSRLSVTPQAEEQIRQYFLLTPQHYDQALTLSAQWQLTHPHWQLVWSTALPPYHLVQVPASSGVV